MKNSHFLISIIIILILSSCEEKVQEGTSSLIDIINEPAGENCLYGGIKVMTGIDINMNSILDDNEIQKVEFICNGADGAYSIIDLLIEPAGENCSNGGYKVISGIDVNMDNILDENEIRDFQYICNGAEGQNSLIDILPEPAGENCSNGGYKIITGIDLNMDNILNENEIRNFQYVCNGTAGQSSLIDILSEPAGENCSNGGYKILSGIDLNNNSSLEESEIQETVFLCNPENPEFDFSQHILEEYSVKSIAFDRNGIAWLGTHSDGLLKYDPFNKSVSSIYPGIIIWDIDIDSKGNVWVASEGLIKYDGETFSHFTTANSDLPEDYVRSIAIDSEDNIWLASNRSGQGGIARFDGTVWDVYTPENSDLPVSSVHCIEIDANDNVWLSLSEKVNQPYLVKISNDEWTIYSGDEFGFVPYWLGKIAVNSKNEVVCAIDYSLSSLIDDSRPNMFIFDGQSSNQIQIENINNIESFTIDNEDKIWAFTFGKYFVHDGNSWVYHEDNLTDVGLWSLEQANDGRMWFGSEQGIYINDN